MDIEALYDMAIKSLQRENLGGSMGYVSLVVPQRSRSPKRVKVMPGVSGKVVGEANEKGYLIVWVEAADLLKALVPQMKNMQP